MCFFPEKISGCGGSDAIFGHKHVNNVFTTNVLPVVKVASSTKQGPGWTAAIPAIVLPHKIQTMKDITTRIRDISWDIVAADRDGRGYALVPGVLAEKECSELIRSVK
jgi:hypothetical protein